MAVDPEDGSWLAPRRRATLALGHGPAGRLDPRDFARAAAEVAWKRRLRLALAVSLLCGVGPGAARLARWRDVDLDAGLWTVPRAHFVPAQRRPGKRARARQSEAFPIPPAADVAFRDAFQVGDGWRLLRRIAPWAEEHLAVRGGEIRLPRPPRAPPPSSSPDAAPAPCPNTPCATTCAASRSTDPHLAPPPARNPRIGRGFPCPTNRKYRPEPAQRVARIVWPICVDPVVELWRRLTIVASGRPHQRAVRCGRKG